MDKEAARRLKSLVKDELSAAETYLQALERLEGEPEAEDLRRLQAEHEDAAALLRDRASDLGVEPPSSSGAWGAWARAVAGAARLMGNASALRALRDGEERGIRDYESALREEGLPPELRALIGDALLPQARRRLPLLDILAAGGPPRGSSYNADQGYGGAGRGRDVA